MPVQRELFNVRSPADALSILFAHLPQGSFLRHEALATRDALDRILTQDVVSSSDLPAFARSAMDGFAVRAADTSGASDGMPAYLTISDDVPMGLAPVEAIHTGHCARISTGGMLPPGADAVIMVEQTHEVGRETIEALRPVAPGDNVVQVGEDVRMGDAVLRRGHRLRPQDLGALLALGITTVSVAQRPRVAIIAGGDELVNPDQHPSAGQIRDVNSYTLAAQVERAGGVARLVGIVRDELAVLEQAALGALETCDVLILSAGSSVSQRDLTATVVDGLGSPGVLVHGVSLKPGKPTILAVCQGKPVFGLPGNPVSCMVTFDLFVAPTIARLLGSTPPSRSVAARLTRNVASATGREDYVYVRLEQAADGSLLAWPVFGKSSLIFSLVRADGMLKVPHDAASLPAGATVEVILL